MSMRTKINGYTAWVNLRLMPYDHLLNNALMDLLTGTHMKFLLESITGRDIKRLESFDDLSQQQKQTRVEWVVDELKTCQVLPDDVVVDSRLFAMRSADHVFDLLWRLISHDIWFVWERAEYLQHVDMDVLTQIPFKWTPDPPPKKKKSKKPKKSLLSGFGSGSAAGDDSGTLDSIDLSSPSPIMADDVMDDWVKYPNAEWVKNFKKKKREIGNYPSPDECILEMVNYQLKTTRDGRNLSCHTIDDFVDSRVLCALVNSFVPNTFTTDLLLNDRWTINLALRTAEKMFYAETPFDSEDLVEADPTAVCAYFCFFLMMAYKYRQCKAAVSRVDYISMLIRECNHEISKFPAIVSNMQELQRRKEVKTEIEQHKQALEKFNSRFDIPYCKKWLNHVEFVQNEVRRQIREKMKSRFDMITAPRNITVNDMCLSCVINLTLTNGSGFYLASNKEVLGDGRKVVLRAKETGDFIDDFSTGRSRGPTVREILKVADAGVVELYPDNYPEIEIFVESQSRNKLLKAGTVFLYQVFPGNTTTWQRLFIKSARENEFETVQKMIVFFQSNPSFINAKEPKTGNTALHWACRNGLFDMVCLLLENGANVDSKNSNKSTPLFAAIEGLHRKICHLLIEWGCDVHCKNVKNLTPFEMIKNDEFKHYLIELYGHYSEIVPKIMEGDKALLDDVIHKHAIKQKQFCSLRSRCINGSTLLHTAAYYGNVAAVKELMQLRVDVNIRDYKGATALHRARNKDILEVLLESGASVDAEDGEANTPLHVKCYGETNAPSEIASIEVLLARNANLARRNIRGLLPIHCCAMQGRVDVIRLMVRADTENNISKAISAEDDKKPPSLLHLAIANDFIECAKWLSTNGFYFKKREQDILLRRIITEQITLNDREEAVKFLLENEADPSPRYPGGNTCLHYAAGLTGSSEVLELLLDHGAEVDPVDDNGCTPLFFATQANNQVAACVLIEQNANVRHKNSQGLTAFDYIVDFEEWIECGYFTDEINARLKAYSLKHARDLIRAISKKVKPNQLHSFQDMRMRSGLSTRSFQPTTSNTISNSHFSSQLPSIRRASVSTGYFKN
ncbi:uncharacterized protein LOC132559772 [Ylistrum balloti]|uniref:uncharacterized protein LOC132559772 n=1 Tax=Ylistrum balloti TaxID=509963 RepID=UPI0029059681|nr:uncharacterized protein LOC132559772 [Ylistrum balloti]